MSEHAPKSHETIKPVETSEVRHAPKSAEARAEIAKHDQEQRKEQLETARAKLDQQPEPGAKAHESAKPAASSHIALDPMQAYRSTMNSLWRRLGPASRTFSKVIHNSAVERTSEIVGATVARPSVTLGATTTAAIVGGVMYWSARYYGFTLSGAELLFGMLVGGVLGFLIELAVRAFGRRPS